MGRAHPPSCCARKAAWPREGHGSVGTRIWLCCTGTVAILRAEVCRQAVGEGGILDKVSKGRSETERLTHFQDSLFQSKL